MRSAHLLAHSPRFVVRCSEDFFCSFAKIIKSRCGIEKDNKIRGIANKNPHESLRGVTIRLVVVPVVLVIEVFVHLNCIGVGNLGEPIGVVPICSGVQSVVAIRATDLKSESLYPLHKYGSHIL